jgi:hypothetical protein
MADHGASVSLHLDQHCGGAEEERLCDRQVCAQRELSRREEFRWRRNETLTGQVREQSFRQFGCRHTHLRGHGGNDGRRLRLRTRSLHEDCGPRTSRRDRGGTRLAPQAREDVNGESPLCRRAGAWQRLAEALVELALAAANEARVLVHQDTKPGVVVRPQEVRDHHAVADTTGKQRIG